MTTTAGPASSTPLRFRAGYAVGILGAALPSLLVGAWFLKYCASGEGGFVLGAERAGALLFAGRIFDAVIDPLVGTASDRARTRFGRRLPFIAAGAPLLALGVAGLYTPPPAGLAPVPWLALALGALWLGYTLAIAPYLALLPEVFPDARERFSVATLMGVADLAGNVLLLAAAGFAVRGIGYRALAAVVAVAAVAALLPTLVLVRERGVPPPAAGARASARAAIAAEVRSWLAILRGPAFLRYVVARTGLLASVSAIVAVTPFLAEVVLGRGEGTAGLLQAWVVVLAGLAFPLLGRFAARVGPAAVFRAGLLAFGLLLPALLTLGPSPAPLAHAAVLYALAAFPVACAFVLPRALMADIIEEDGRRTGARREGLYFGLEGLLTKAGTGLGPLIVGASFALLGDAGAGGGGSGGDGAAGAAAAPSIAAVLGVGPLAAVPALLGWWAFRRYPLR